MQKKRVNVQCELQLPPSGERQQYRQAAASKLRMAAEKKEKKALKAQYAYEHVDWSLLFVVVVIAVAVHCI